jgi:serine/threonine protein phosphatase PrpC
MSKPSTSSVVPTPHNANESNVPLMTGQAAEFAAVKPAKIDSLKNGTVFTPASKPNESKPIAPSFMESTNRRRRRCHRSHRGGQSRGSGDTGIPNPPQHHNTSYKPYLKHRYGKVRILGHHEHSGYSKHSKHNDKQNTKENEEQEKDSENTHDADDQVSVFTPIFTGPEATRQRILEHYAEADKAKRILDNLPPKAVFQKMMQKWFRDKVGVESIEPQMVGSQMVESQMVESQMVESQLIPTQLIPTQSTTNTTASAASTTNTASVAPTHTMLGGQATSCGRRSYNEDRFLVCDRFMCTPLTVNEMSNLTLHDPVDFTSSAWSESTADISKQQFLNLSHALQSNKSVHTYRGTWKGVDEFSTQSGTLTLDMRPYYVPFNTLVCVSMDDIVSYDGSWREVTADENQSKPKTGAPIEIIQAFHRPSEMCPPNEVTIQIMVRNPNMLAGILLINQPCVSKDNKPTTTLTLSATFQVNSAESKTKVSKIGSSALIQSSTSATKDAKLPSKSVFTAPSYVCSNLEDAQNLCAQLDEEDQRRFGSASSLVSTSALSPPPTLQSFYGVFDGHGGSGASEKTTTILPLYLKRLLVECPQNPILALRLAYRLVHTQISQYNFRKRIENAHDPTYESPDTPGTTAVTVLVNSQTHEIYCANAGDSRAVMGQHDIKSNDIKAVALSIDDKPSRPDEYKRIKKAKGAAIGNRVYRLNDSISVSRAIGDPTYTDIKFEASEKESKIIEWNEWVTCEATVVKNKFTHPDEFILLGCDGVFDCISNEAAVEFIKTRLKTLRSSTKHITSKDLDTICVSLIEHISSHRSFGDNTTCVLIIPIV